MISKNSFQLLWFCDLCFCIRFFIKTPFSAMKMNLFPNKIYFRCYRLKTSPPMHCVISATIVLFFFFQFCHYAFHALAVILSSYFLEATDVLDSAI